MGARRQQEEQPTTPEEQQALYALALALVDPSTGTDLSALAALLVPLLLARPASDAAAREVTSLIVEGVPEVDGTSGVLREARIEQLLYRAAYALMAGRRLASTETREDFARAVERERAYFDSHLRMNGKREAGAQDTVRLMERYGEVLSWNAVIRPTSRPHHKAADGKNYRPALGPPIQTGAHPGVLDNCLCYAGPPRAGASMLA